MKFLCLFSLILIVNSTFAQSETQKKDEVTSVADTTVMNPLYDKALAEKLGGDEYGMKSYFFVILKTDEATNLNGQLVQDSFRGHLDNIQRLVEEGVLVVAGPLEKNDKKYRGIFILHNIQSVDEAHSLLQTDPAIKNGLLDVDIFTWYGSAALPEYLQASDKIWKSKP